MSIIIDGTGAISGVSATGLTTAQTVTQSAIATGVAGTGPAFSAYSSTLTSVPNTTYTKIVFNTKSFDTASAFDSTTNYRFQPATPGYYQFNLCVQAAAVGGSSEAGFFKNGSAINNGMQIPNNAATGTILSASCLIYLNGTDYVEVYMWQNSGGTVNCGSNSVNYSFSGSMVRAA